MHQDHAPQDHAPPDSSSRRARQRHAIHLGAAWEPPVPGPDGCVRWMRRFGRPAGLGPGDVVRLVVDRPGVAASIAVNGVPLPPVVRGVERWEAEITPLLRDRNDIELLAALPSSAAGRSPMAAGRGPLPPAVGAVGIEIDSWSAASSAGAGA